jgi:hypothetical protein
MWVMILRYVFCVSIYILSFDFWPIAAHEHIVSSVIQQVDFRIPGAMHGYFS